MTDNLVRVVNGAIDDEDGDIILRGRLDIETLENLRVPEYQWGAPNMRRLNELDSVRRAMGNGAPDVTLSMRGDRYTQRHGTFALRSPVYIVNGVHQTIAVQNRYLEARDREPLRLGATIYINKDMEWERRLFNEMNVRNARISANMRLRNRRWDVSALHTLWSMTTHPSPCLLCDRVQWNQEHWGGYLITANRFTRAAGRIHAHIDSAVWSRNRTRMSDAVDRIMSRVGEGNFVRNVNTFWNLVDTCWGIVQERDRRATHIQQGFLDALALMLASYTVFWNPRNSRQLRITRRYTQRLRTFPLNTRQNYELALAEDSFARDELATRMATHVDDGDYSLRRTLRSNMALYRHSRISS